MSKTSVGFPLMDLKLVQLLCDDLSRQKHGVDADSLSDEDFAAIEEVAVGMVEEYRRELTELAQSSFKKSGPPTTDTE